MTCMSKLPGFPRNKWALWLLLLLGPGVCQAKPVTLSWDFPRDYVPAPENFILAQTQNGMPEKQSRVALAAKDACPIEPGDNHNTFCTQLAQCPAPGSTVAYWVFAQWGTTVTGPTNIATCYTKPGEPCVCHDPLEVLPPPPLPPPPRPIAQEPPPQQQTTPPAHGLATTAPQALASANPIVPVFQIPTSPASAGT
jgi:hypothetical protein